MLVKDAPNPKSHRKIQYNILTTARTRKLSEREKIFKNNIEQKKKKSNQKP